MDDLKKKDARINANSNENSDAGGEESREIDFPRADLQDETNTLLVSKEKEDLAINEVVEDSEKLLEKKQEEVRRLNDRLLRAQAEFENYKKRMAREKANMLKFGNESLMQELLPVIDNLELSLEHANAAKNVESIIEGIEIIRKELLRRLEKFGLRVIAAQGEKFDPDEHESVAQIETSDYPEGTVVEELQKGYFIHDRLLRPAKVTVAKASNCNPPEGQPVKPNEAIKA